MLARMLDGRSWTATELSRAAGVSPSTGSAHLSKMLALGWVKVLPQGRHRYFCLAGSEIAAFLETFAQMSPDAPARTPGERRASETLRHCRLCYDHLAGRVGVALTEALLRWGWIAASPSGFAMTAAGRRGWSAAGFRLGAEEGKACMDWSERRLHVAGPLGREIAAALLDRSWLQRDPRSRALWITPLGQTALAKLLDPGP